MSTQQRPQHLQVLSSLYEELYALGHTRKNTHDVWEKINGLQTPLQGYTVQSESGVFDCVCGMGVEVGESAFYSSDTDRPYCDGGCIETELSDPSNWRSVAFEHYEGTRKHGKWNITEWEDFVPCCNL